MEGVLGHLHVKEEEEEEGEDEEAEEEVPNFGEFPKQYLYSIQNTLIFVTVSSPVVVACPQM